MNFEQAKEVFPTFKRIEELCNSGSFFDMKDITQLFEENSKVIQSTEIEKHSNVAGLIIVGYFTDSFMKRMENLLTKLRYYHGKVKNYYCFPFKSDYNHIELYYFIKGEERNE